MKSFQLTEIDKQTLLRLAREKLSAHFGFDLPQPSHETQYSEALNTSCGLFVSLHLGSELRGCIGTFKANNPLYQSVQDMALSSAFNDYRFEPLTREELPEITIEISVLTPLKKIKSIDEVELGKHGIYISDGSRSGTFLPQVASQTGWTKEEFLGHCSRDKAGLGWLGWQKAELYVYEAIVFSEDVKN